MPTLYFREDCQKWRVQSKRRNGKSISAQFDSLNEAIEFWDDVKAIEVSWVNKYHRDNTNEKLDKLKEF